MGMLGAWTGGDALRVGASDTSDKVAKHHTRPSQIHHHDFYSSAMALDIAERTTDAVRTRMETMRCSSHANEIRPSYLMTSYISLPTAVQDKELWQTTTTQHVKDAFV